MSHAACRFFALLPRRADGAKRRLTPFFFALSPRSKRTARALNALCCE
jgi:hypothetical protein